VFERFTVDARQVIVGAQHLVLDLIREGDGVAARIELVAEPTRVRQKIIESTQG